MARLEYINFEKFDVSLDESNQVQCLSSAKHSSPKLPQIFWNNATSWHEANLWSLDRTTVSRVDPETVKRNMKHLITYANFLEELKTDWRHFPTVKADRPLLRFKKYLIDRIADSSLNGSTAKNCMASVIQFYRFADMHDLVGNQSPMWTDRMAIIRKRSMNHSLVA
jgi:hypothetical protein